MRTFRRSTLLFAVLAPALVAAPHAHAAGAIQTLDATIEATVILSLGGDGPTATANSAYSLVATTPSGELVWGTHDADGGPSVSELACTLAARCNLLGGALEKIGFRVFRPAGTYFILADHTKGCGFSDLDFRTLCGKGRVNCPKIA